jgi:hypothetical protein
VALGLAGALGVTATPTVAGAAVASAEVITHPGTSTPLASGGSATPYGVILPAGASCPGDTAHDGYHVYSYLVPAGTTPTDVSFKTGLPGKWFGYIADGAYYGAINTAESTGQINGLPTSFTWSRLTPADLFTHGAHTATWEGGIACADTHGVVTDYWNSEVVFTADPSDPGGFTWKVVHQGEVPSSSGSNTTLWVGVGLLVIAAGATAYALRERRRQAGRSEPADGAGTEGDPVEPEPAPVDSPSGASRPVDVQAGDAQPAGH